MASDIKGFYKSRIDSFTTERLLVEKQINLISNLRLAVFVFTAGLIYLCIKYELPELAGVSAVIGIAVFTWLCIFHEKLFQKKRRLSNLVTINEDGVKRVTDNWNEFKETGGQFIDDNHPYSSDLDIFGKSSLFQWINATNTFYGKKFLSEALCGENPDHEQIAKNQEAIKELSPLIDFRQGLQVAGFSKACSNDPGDIIRWAEKGEDHKTMQKFGPIFSSLPYISAAVLLTDLLFFKTKLLPAFFYSLQAILFGIYLVRSLRIFDSFENGSKPLKGYSHILSHIEGMKFSSELLQKHHGNLTGFQGVSASVAIGKLSKILARAEIRFNPLVHFVLNIVWLWDIKCALMTLEWKNKFGKKIHLWFEKVGQIEKLSSLAILSFEHPSWPFPEIMNSRIALHGENIRHPLIPDESSTGNNFSLNAQKSTAIITGSNMSGKSTFLRTIGVNLVLAYAGAPVCADSMSCGILNIYTSMRTKDSLKGNVSTFFSELLRIKQILSFVNSGRNVLFLIDEIFSGTNSTDRITGATAVLKSLQSDNSLGLISTHDLELCELEKETENKFVNYHFREYYENNSVRFDYKIYPGPSKTRNAVYLMKMVGIL